MDNTQVTPEDIRWPADWEPLLDEKIFLAELKKELNLAHTLAGVKVIALARRLSNDDVIFELKASNLSLPSFALVHLTWTGKKEISSVFPTTEFYTSLEEVFKDAAG